MVDFNNLTYKKKLFGFIFIGFILLKYTYLLLNIMYVPSIIVVILKEVILITLFTYFAIPLLDSRKGRVFLLLFALSFTVLFMSNFWYNRYFGNYLSISDILLKKGSGQFSFITILFRHLIKPYDFVFIIDILLLMFLLPEKKIINSNYYISTYKKKDKSNKDKFFYNGYSKAWKYLLIIIIGGLLISQMLFTNFLEVDKRPIELYQKNTSKFVNIYGILPLYLIEIYEYLAPEKFYVASSQTLDFKEINQFDNNTPLKQKQNIIVIQLESFDANLLNYKYQGKELTPFLNKLKKESLYFTNFYAQHVNGSFDADLAFLTSLYPVNRNYAFRENDFSSIPSLPKILKNNGYNTLAFHGNTKKFFCRDKAYPDLGFDKFYSLDDYSQQNLKMNIKKHNLGINDYDFFNQSVDLLNKSDEPFLAYFITLSSHTPFYYYPENKAQEEFSNINNLLTQDYFNSITFLDKSLEMFFAKLEDESLLEDTMIVIYSDHQSNVNSDVYSSAGVFNLTRHVNPPESIPLIIKYPDSKSNVIDTSGSVTDIAPTILDILGLENLPQTFTGNSLLSGKEESILFLHENPIVLYQNQLFLIQEDEYKKVGYVKNAERKNITIPEMEKRNIEKIINDMRNVIFRNTRNYRNLSGNVK
ncbi:MAG: LTA synthase family protein [Halanaerobiales bacterium]